MERKGGMMRIRWKGRRRIRRRMQYMQRMIIMLKPRKILKWIKIWKFYMKILKNQANKVKNSLW